MQFEKLNQLAVLYRANSCLTPDPTGEPYQSALESTGPTFRQIVICEQLYIDWSDGTMQKLGPRSCRTVQQPL